MSIGERSEVDSLKTRFKDLGTHIEEVFFPVGSVRIREKC